MTSEAMVRMTLDEVRALAEGILVKYGLGAAHVGPVADDRGGRARCLRRARHLPADRLRPQPEVPAALHAELAGLL